MAVAARAELEHAQPPLTLVSSRPAPHSPEQVFGDFPLAKDGQSKNSPFADISRIPRELRRRTLQTLGRTEIIPETTTGQRGIAIELYVRDILNTQKDVVKKAELHNQASEKGSDLIVELRDGLPLQHVRVEVKSSTRGLIDYKHALRDKYLIRKKDQPQLDGPWGRLTIRQWNALSEAEKEDRISKLLTELQIILINGGEKDEKEKTPDEILTESFYPQLQRILSAAAPHGEKRIGIFPKTDQLRTWKWVHTGEFAASLEFNDQEPTKPKAKQPTKIAQLQIWPELPEGQFTHPIERKSDQLMMSSFIPIPVTTLPKPFEYIKRGPQKEPASAISLGARLRHKATSVVARHIRS